MKISHELKMKIITAGYEGTKITQHHSEFVLGGTVVSVPLYQEVELSLNLNVNFDLLKECMSWYELIMDSFSSEMKGDIGYFKGLYPIKVDIMKSVVTFSADVFNSENQNWKDWFITEE